MSLSKDVYDKMRDYQKEAFHKMVNAGAFLEYDDMGLGKTLTLLATIHQLEATPCLIVTAKFGLAVWEQELLNWFGEECVIYTGKPAEREDLWKKFVTGGFKFLVTNYAMLGELALRSGIDVKEVRTALQPTGSFKWQGIVWDEAHLGGLFNHKSEAFKISAKFAKVIPKRFPATGTPMRQGVIDLYGPLHLINPVRFKNYWSFVGTYCVKIKTPFGQSIERNPANVPAFREMLKYYMVRRVKDEVLDELPGKWRQPLFVTMNKEQQKAYNDLVMDMFLEVPETGELIFAPNQMTIGVRQRQILACPQVLGFKGRGGALDTIMEHSHTTLDEDKPIAIFTPFRQAVPFIEEALLAEYKDIEIYKITGGLTAEEFGNQWKNFQASKKGKRALICVIKSGASFQATAASTAYFLGYEWDATMNEQAEDRLHRMGQKCLVNIYYLMYKDTIDEDVAKRLNEKKTSSDLVVGTDMQYKESMRRLYAKQVTRK